MDGSVVIRRSTPEDLESFWRCLDAVARDCRWLALVEAPPIEEARKFLDEARSFPPFGGAGHWAA
jgi:hypothetical protein